MVAKVLETPRSPVRGFLADLPGRTQFLWTRAMKVGADVQNLGPHPLG